MSEITKEERERLRAQHFEWDGVNLTGPCCIACDLPFPCPTVRLFDALEAAERQLFYANNAAAMAEPFIKEAAEKQQKAEAQRDALAEALRDLMDLAEPHFTDAVQQLALQRAHEASDRFIAAIKKEEQA